VPSPIRQAEREDAIGDWLADHGLSDAIPRVRGFVGELNLIDLVRRLVSRNDGEIDLESRPGRTKVCVALPLADTDGFEGRS
jgi:hypothetical protein